LIVLPCNEPSPSEETSLLMKFSRARTRYRPGRKADATPSPGDRCIEKESDKKYTMKQATVLARLKISASEYEHNTQRGNLEAFRLR